MHIHQYPHVISMYLYVQENHTGIWRHSARLKVASLHYRQRLHAAARQGVRRLLCTHYKPNRQEKAGKHMRARERSTGRARESEPESLRE